MFGGRALVVVLLLTTLTQVHGDRVQDLLDKLRKAVDKALVQAQEKLDEAKALLQLHATGYEADGRAQMEAIKQDYVNQLNQIKTENKDKDISSCLGENEAKVDNLVAEYGARMDNCVNQEINEGTKYAQDALDRVKKIVSDVENIRQEIKDCGHGWKAAKCLAKLAARIEREITNLPKIIEADVIATGVKMAQLEPKMKSCVSDQVNSCRNQGQQLVDTIRTCVQNIH